MRELLALLVALAAALGLPAQPPEATLAVVVGVVSLSIFVFVINAFAFDVFTKLVCVFVRQV